MCQLQWLLWHFQTKRGTTIEIYGEGGGDQTLGDHPCSSYESLTGCIMQSCGFLNYTASSGIKTPVNSAMPRGTRCSFLRLRMGTVASTAAQSAIAMAASSAGPFTYKSQESEVSIQYTAHICYLWLLPNSIQESNLLPLINDIWLVAAGSWHLNWVVT